MGRVEDGTQMEKKYNYVGGQEGDKEYNISRLIGRGLIRVAPDVTIGWTCTGRPIPDESRRTPPSVTPPTPRPRTSDG